MFGLRDVKGRIVVEKGSESKARCMNGRPSEGSFKRWLEMGVDRYATEFYAAAVSLS